MNKAYRRLIMAITIALAALALTFLTVGALELTPPYVIDIKDMGASRPRNIAVDPLTGYSYVLNQQGQVWVFTKTEVVATFSVGSIPNIGVDPGRYTYVTSAAGDPIRVLRGQQLSGTVSGLNKPTSAVAVLTSTHYAYVTLPEDNAVAVLNGTQVVNAGIPVGARPSAIAANPTTGLVYAVNSGNNTVSIIQGQAVINTIAVGITPTAVTVNPANGYVYVANSGDDTITILQGTTKVGSPIPVGMAPNDIAVNPTNGRVYIVNAGDGSNVGSISILSATQWLTDTYVGDDPRAVDVNPTTGYIYVAGGVDISGTVSVLSDTLKVETFLPVGHGPSDIAVNPKTDLAYASLYRSSGGTSGQVVLMGRTKAAIVILDENSPATPLDTENPDVTITIPANAVTQTVTLLYTEWEPDTSPYLFARPGFILKAYILGVHQPSYQFNQAITVCSVSPLHENDMTLRTGRSGEEDWSTSGILSQSRDASGSVVTASIKTLPYYSHAGYALTTSTRRLYLAVVMRSYR